MKLYEKKSKKNKLKEERTGKVPLEGIPNDYNLFTCNDRKS